MRAKEYAEMYLRNPDDRTLVQVANEFLLEIPAIARKRGAKMDAAFVSVVKEQDQKWNCFARKLAKAGHDDIDPDGLKKLISIKYPDLYQAVWGRAPAAIMRQLPISED